MTLTATVALILLQAPQVAGQPPGTPVVVELASGGEIEGVVVSDGAGFVELRVGRQTVVGFRRSEITGIRAARAADVAHDATPLFEPQDQWFVLHDEAGNVVGRMHSTIVQDDAGRFRLGEEWEFRQADMTSGVTLLEVVDGRMNPVSSFFHERMTRNLDGRVMRETLVRGVVEGERFIVDRKGSRAPSRVDYELDPQMRFPLSVWQFVRDRCRQPVQESWTVFDARTGEFARRELATRVRNVIWQGDPVRVTELLGGVAGRSNTEWLDSSCRTMRREVNGPSLVAVPVAAEMTERYLMSKAPMFPSAVVEELSGRFALWLPSPSWRPVELDESGQIMALEEISGASASLVAFDQLEAEATVDSAADTVTRWLHKVSDLAVAERERLRIRGVDGVRLGGSHVDHSSGSGSVMRSEVYVFPARGTYVAMCFTAPKLVYDDARADFTRILRSVDLFPRAAGAPK